MSLTASEVHALKKASPVQGVLPVIHERWSARSFAEREVSPEALWKVFEAARCLRREQPTVEVCGGVEGFRDAREDRGDAGGV
jgi:hypothetical protein